MCNSGVAARNGLHASGSSFPHTLIRPHRSHLQVSIPSKQLHQISPLLVVSAMASDWDGEATFMKELEKCVERPTESRLKRMAEIAVEAEKLHYKSIVKLIDRAFKRADGPSAQLHVLYALSEVLRLSWKQLGSGDKFREHRIPADMESQSHGRMDGAAQIVAPRQHLMMHHLPSQGNELRL
jgi:hypothetical protein